LGELKVERTLRTGFLQAGHWVKGAAESGRRRVNLPPHTAQLPSQSSYSYIGMALNSRTGDRVGRPLVSNHCHPTKCRGSLSSLQEGSRFTEHGPRVRTPAPQSGGPRGGEKNASQAGPALVSWDERQIESAVSPATSKPARTRRNRATLDPQSIKRLWARLA